MGGLERRLHNLELQLRSPVPLEDTDLPIEKWVDELLTNSSGPALYGIEEDEWARFNSWIEMLGNYLRFQLGLRIASARGEKLGLEDEMPPLSEEVLKRVVDAAEPHIEYWRERYEEAAPQREAKRRAAREYHEWRRLSS